MAGLTRGVLIAVVAALLFPGAALARGVEVVVRLEGPGLARAFEQSRVLADRTKERRLDLRSATSRSYLRDLQDVHTRFERALAAQVPSAHVRWRYRIVLNGVAVVVPERDVSRLARLPGVRDVLPNASYEPQLDQSPGVIGATRLWSDPLATRGDGVKIGIIDDGVDVSHPFFTPNSYAMPAGFPKGQVAFTSSKVIVARAFPPPGASWPHAREPFDPQNSGHGTHVAGIAAGNAGTPTTIGPVVSGVAPRAYIGNYRVMTVPSENFGLNGNAPEIVRGIEAAVADGMDVINLSLGEPEVEPTRDVVALALDAAAAAGVVPVAAAGNSRSELGQGSVGSPASSARAIAVGAAAAEGTRRAIASFSSAGPTPVSLRLKPEVAAPGVNILSSTPRTIPGTGWEVASGTSMAAPHVAGAAALLVERHADWTTEQVKAALVATAARINGVPVALQGAGVIDVAEAANPLVLARPSAISFGIARPRQLVRAAVRLTDAGGGAGMWSASVVAERGGRTQLTAQVPGTLVVATRAPAAEGPAGGVVELRRGSDVRRIPFWLVVARPDLPRPSMVIRRAGTYTGSTVGRRSTVRRYRFPDLPNQSLGGPEQVVRFVLGRNAANLGVAVTSGGVEPRIVRGANENRIAGNTALPINTNPYQRTFDRRIPIAAVLRPRRGVYDFVFDSRARGSRFTFRVWVDDRTAPGVRLLSATAAGGAVRFRVADGGSGVDPSSLVAFIGSRQLPVTLRRGIAYVGVRELRAGTHTLVFQVSDRQEAKNNENVAGVLPNTRSVRATIRVP